jgi:hypothetical protein
MRGAFFACRYRTAWNRKCHRAHGLDAEREGEDSSVQKVDSIRLGYDTDSCSWLVGRVPPCN